MSHDRAGIGLIAEHDRLDLREFDWLTNMRVSELADHHGLLPADVAPAAGSFPTGASCPRCFNRLEWKNRQCRRDGISPCGFCDRNNVLAWQQRARLGVDAGLPTHIGDVLANMFQQPVLPNTPTMSTFPAVNAEALRRRIHDDATPRRCVVVRMFMRSWIIGPSHKVSIPRLPTT